MTFSKKHTLTVALLTAATVAVPFVLRAADIHVAVTPSINERFVKVKPVSEAGRGDYVAFCRPLHIGNIPRGGKCPDGTIPLVKRVIAAKGDIVMFTPTEIRVIPGDGGEPKFYSAPHHDPKLPHPGWGQNIFVDVDQVVVIGDHVHSVDSRYFGLVGAEFDAKDSGV